MLLSGLAILGLTTSCEQIDPNAPKGELCLVDSQAEKCRCYNSKTDKFYDKTLAQCHSYLARHADYDQELNAWCKEGWRRAEEKQHESN